MVAPGDILTKKTKTKTRYGYTTGIIFVYIFLNCWSVRPLGWRFWQPENIPRIKAEIRSPSVGVSPLGLLFVIKDWWSLRGMVVDGGT